MAEPIIRFSDVKKSFGPKVIYTGLDLEVFRGETLTVIGGSGAGKSVMLKMLIRLLQARTRMCTLSGGRPWWA